MYGFFRHITRWTEHDHEFVVLHYASAPPPPEIADRPNVSLEPVDDSLRNWARRTVWESVRLPGLLRNTSADILFNPSGALTPRIPIPQVVLCQNPWCYVPEVHQGVKERWKAALQRRGYRNALQGSDLILFISDFLRSLYRGGGNPHAEAPSKIAYVGVDENTYTSARELANSGIDREDFSIVSVSAMAPWKGIETVVSAVSRLRQRGVPARLRLVGPWPDSSYEQQIRNQIRAEQLESAVEIAGKVSKEELHQSYARARVFCLMSRCESFGIPAAEAQAFGTPAVLSTGCAMPEVCGDGCLSCAPRDVNGTADLLETLLTDSQEWQRRSTAALENVGQLRWQDTARPLMSMFELN